MATRRRQQQQPPQPQPPQQQQQVEAPPDTASAPAEARIRLMAEEQLRADFKSLEQRQMQDVERVVRGVLAARDRERQLKHALDKLRLEPAAVEAAAAAAATRRAAARP